MAHILKKLKDGTIWGAASQGGLGVLAILISATLARTLSTEDLALFFLVLPFVRFLSVVLSFGMPSGLQKRVGIASHIDDWTEVGRIFTTASKVFLGVLVPLGLAFTVFWPHLAETLFLGKFSTALGGVVFLLVVLQSLEQLGAAFLRGAQRMRLGLLFTGVPRQSLFLSVLLVGWLFFGQWTIQQTLIAYAAISILSIAALFIFLSRYMRSTPPTGGVKTREFATFCLPMMIHACAAALFISVDIWVLGLFRTSEDVALYGATTRLVVLVPFAAYILNMVLPAMVASLYAKGQLRKLTVLVRTAATGNVILGGSLTAVFVFLGEDILSIVYGDAFAGNWMILAILAIGQSANVAFGSSGIILQMTGHHTVLMYTTVLTSLINLFGNLLVVTEYGPTGVALVSACSLFLQNAFITLIAYRQTGILTLPHPTMIRPRYLRHILRR